MEWRGVGLGRHVQTLLRPAWPVVCRHALRWRLNSSCSRRSATDGRNWAAGITGNSREAYLEWYRPYKVSIPLLAPTAICEQRALDNCRRAIDEHEIVERITMRKHKSFLFHGSIYKVGGPCHAEHTCPFARLRSLSTRHTTS